MKIEKNILEKSVVELIVEESVENVAKQRKKALAYMQDNADIQGFRKGTKIPENVIIRKYGEDHISKMMIDFAIDDIYRKALTTEKLMPVAQGEIKEIISESPLKIKIHIEVFPDISIDAKYKKIALTKKKTSVTAAEVKQAISEIETKFTTFVEETKKTVKAKMGDQVTIDTDGSENGKPLEATSMRDHPIVLGSNMLVPGFEESIVGMKTGETKEFPVEFPADYHNAGFAGKKTTFSVTVNKLETAQKPEFTPEFIEQLRGKKLDIDGFKDLIKSEILDTKDSNARLEEENELIDELIKISKIEIGDNLLAKKIDQVYSEIKENVSQDGVKMDDYLMSLKLSEEEYKDKNVAPVALKRLQGELILHKLVEMEKVEISDKEMDAEISEIMARFESEDVLKRLKELYVPGTKYYEELRQKASYKKLIDSFFKAPAAKKAPAKK